MGVRFIALELLRRWKDCVNDHIWLRHPTYSGPVIPAPKTANATYSATLSDQLWADGLTAAFIAPGSRSTPLALALVAHPGIVVHVMHDERVAGFAALGYGLATGTPAIVLCSSGTAGAHFFGAVIEADASAVPLIVVTADRPPELWGRGAPQTIDQTDLYGSRVRAFFEPGPPDDPEPALARPLARAIWLAATADLPGPVHLNQSFRDPLTGSPDVLPVALDALPQAQAEAPDEQLVTDLLAQLAAPRGVIVAGRCQTDPADILQLAARLRWPVLSDHRSGCRQHGTDVVVRHFDSLLRDPSFAAAQRPDVVLRIGEIVSSKATSQWLTASAAAGTTVLSSRPHGRYIDPEDIATTQFNEAGVIAALNSRAIPVKSGPESGRSDWLACWSRADTLAADAVARVVASTPRPNEITIAQACVQAVPAGGALVVSSSMPVRDVEWFGPNRADISVLANRGANGIDGIVSTAIGVASSGQPTVCLIGDVAFLHDSTSLIALRNRPIDLTIVVTNNDGGGIFSFLPQHQLLDEHDYEQLFGTPHGTDLLTLAAAHGVTAEPFGGVIPAPDGVRVVLATSDRDSNLALHHQVHAAVADALAAPGES